MATTSTRLLGSLLRVSQHQPGTMRSLPLHARAVASVAKACPRATASACKAHTAARFGAVPVKCHQPRSLRQLLPSRHACQQSAWAGKGMQVQAASSSNHQQPPESAQSDSLLSRVGSWVGMAAVVAAVLSSTTQPAMAQSLFPWGSGTQSSTTATATPATLEMRAPDPSTSELAPEEVATVNLFKDNTPSVVNIANIGRRQDRWTMDVQNVPQGLGSGFIWDQQGHIVTNFHVIRNAAEVQVALIDQSVHRATLVGGDPDKDIAVLKLQCDASKLKELKPVILGNSSNLLVGQKVYAIGNPFGLDHTLTQGIISGLGRELATPGPRGVPIRNAIQTDAAINPGNSGGVLLDSKGRLIGINTAIADPTGRGASSGVGFAIPVDSARGLVEQILKFGRVVRPVLGITIAPPQAVRQLGVDGVLVLEVPSGSPAAKAGIKGTYRDAGGRLVLGDVITGINGKPVKLQKDLFGILDDLKPNDRIQVEVLRDGQPRQVTVTLGERSDDNATRGGYIQAD